MSEQNVQEEVVVSLDALKAELTNKMNNTSIN